MGNYTVDEHYISRFIIKNFADEHGKVRVINKSKQPIEPYSSLPEKLFFSCNLFETKNNDGTYFDRNAIEKGFSDFERRLSAELPQIIKRADENKKLNRYQIKCLAELVAFQLVRLPFIRKLFFESNDNITDQTERTSQTNAMYRIVIDSPESAFSYLENNEFTLSEDAKNNIRETKANTAIYDFINNECNVYLIKAETDAFCIGDFPVLIDAFTNARYLFPVSPRVAIVCALTEPNDTEQYDTIQYVKKDMVSFMNQRMIEKAERFIAFCHLDETYILGEVQKALKGMG
ncbi:MAG: DUF4238 domain-containing protein [Clostridia bacterium]|nr:DUF4238 domain-containing protein [Clostridia bacterium]